MKDCKSFVFLTDNESGFRHESGLDYQDYLNFSCGADLLTHDAEYKEDEYKKTRSWGRCTYQDALKPVLEANVKESVLFHHNQERSDDAVGAIVDKSHKEINWCGSDIKYFAVCREMELML